jgi:hypothetical protein
VSDGMELGFAGLLQAGVDPRQAWQQIRDSIDDGVLRVIAELERTPEGRAALAYSRERWAAYGLEPPWEGLG